MCQENFSKFKDGTWRLGDFITGDEAWFYWQQSGKKQSNKNRVAEGEKVREEVKVGRFEKEVVFEEAKVCCWSIV